MISGTVQYPTHTALLMYWCNTLWRQYPAVIHWFKTWLSPAAALQNSPVYLYFFSFYVRQVKAFRLLPLWHYWSPQKVKSLTSLSVVLGPASPFSWGTESVGCCLHWGRPDGADRLWPPPASQLDGPGSVCSLVCGLLPMPLQQKRPSDPSCHIASTGCVHLLLPLPVNDEQCLLSGGFALPHSQWAKCVAATEVYRGMRLH